jgi:hypothetical protein
MTLQTQYIMKNTLSVADLMIIVDTLNHSLRVVNYGGFTEETREHTMNKVIDIMSNIDVEIVCGDVEPIVVSGDLGG